MVYAPDGKLLSDATWYSNYRSSPEIVVVGPKPKPKPKPKPPATQPHDHALDDDADGPMGRALAIAARSHSGVRVGRSVVASTVPWAVQPSAITAPSRSIAYSNRKRAPRTSRQRVWTSSRSSNTRRSEEPDVRLEHERLDPLVAQPLVAAGEPLEELDARDLEPHQVVRVVRDALRVGLGEPDPDRAPRSRSLPSPPLCQRTSWSCA